MVRVVCLMILWALNPNLYAQRIDAFVTASVNKKKVLLEQPVKIKVTAYSATWFAEPLTIGNLQVSGAFVQSFKRTQSGIRYINKKKYASLEFHYILFPYNEGELTIPELTITTSIPPEGGYKGRPVTLKTKALVIEVDPVPPDADPSNWLVANDARISERWFPDPGTLKIGDVVTRTITIRAFGTLPSFIDAPDIGEIDFGSLYTSEPVFKDERDNKNVNGSRTDTYSYLLEQEGTFTLPEVEVKWWNPHAGRYYSRQLPTFQLTIAANPDLSSLNQLKDSLNALNQSMVREEEVAGQGVDYKGWMKKIALVILVLLILRVLVWGVVKVYHWISVKRKTYFDSEPYWFRKVMNENGMKGLLNHLYHWLDISGFPTAQKTLTNLANGDQELKEEFEKIQQKAFSSKEDIQVDYSAIKKGLRKLRGEMIKRRDFHSEDRVLRDLNP